MAKFDCFRFLMKTYNLTLLQIIRKSYINTEKDYEENVANFEPLNQ